MRKILLSFSLILMSHILYAESDSLEIITPVKALTYDLNELKKKVPTVVWTIDDPVYGKKKTYDAFLLDDILKLVSTSELKKSDIDEIVFHAKDGYSPAITIDEESHHSGALAFQEHDNPQQWALVEQGKTHITPAPFYLVWKNSLAHDGLPKPYQLVKIEFVSFHKKYDKVYPKGAATDSGPMNGFRTFKENCIRCHSINLQGGDVGPELNIPKNVTEYWNSKTLKKFIQDAKSFHAKSKMPAFKDFSENQIHQIIEYLKYMKEHKAQGAK